jgi:hypothetical protein
MEMTKVRETEALWQGSDGIWRFKQPCVTVEGESVEPLILSHESSQKPNTFPSAQQPSRDTGFRHQ